jgi:N-acetylglucosamine-6-phosphate deacetylase
MADSYIVKTGALALPGGMLEGGTLAAQGGIIDYIGTEDAAVLADEDPRFRGRACLDLHDAVLLPGLTEMHIHGAFGHGCETLKGGGELLDLAKALRSRGIGRFVPTMLWDEEAVASLVAAIESSGLSRNIVPGIYLEGPFISPARRGGIGEAQIRRPDPVLLERILAATKGRLALMTVAPELDGIQALYPRLAEAGVSVSLGHSAADASTPLPRAPFSITHLFNAMTGLDHRRGGLANIALSGAARWVELNADGVHVNASAMTVASRCVSRESLILTSDAVVAAGLPHGEYSYFGRKAISDARGVRYADSGTLIGSSRLGMEIVLSYCRATGSPLAAGIAAMSVLPGEALGLRPSEAGGVLELGATDDLFAWDKDFKACRPLRELTGGAS